MQQNIYALKIYYIDIKKSILLTSTLPLTIIARAKNAGYIYYNDFDIQTKYKIAVELFKQHGIIFIGDNDIKMLDCKSLPFIGKNDSESVDDIGQNNIIEYFIKYNIQVKNILTTVFHKEYITAVKLPSIFMDCSLKDITALETNIKEFIVSVYRRFLSTQNGSIPFIPWFGTNIKQYLYKLSSYQAAEMIQGELDGITHSLKMYFVENDIADIDFSALVQVIDNKEYDVVQYKILLTVDNAKYSIIIK